MGNVFRSVLGSIQAILTGDATAGDVLSGKTFYKDDANTKLTGSMTNNGAVSQALDCGDSYTVPAGYHNGSGTVTANSLASQTGIDSGKTAIDASHVLSGYQGWANGNKISGTYTAPTITSITPSNSSPVSLSSGSNYSPTASGYAISSYTSKTPSSSPSSVSSGSIYKMGGSGYVIDTYSSITPSSTGAYFSSGMKYMNSSGYAYSSQPQMTETTLWTNSSPTSSFASQTVTLSQDMDNFSYLKITVRASTTSDKRIGVIISVSDFKNTVTSGQGASLGICGGNSGTHARRAVAYTSDTQVWFSNAASSGTSYNNTAIPVSISGLKY